MSFECSKRFDNSVKLKFPIGADTQVTQAEFDPRPIEMIHPLVDPNTAEKVMMSAVERIHKWNEENIESKYINLTLQESKINCIKSKKSLTICTRKKQHLNHK